MLKMAKFHGQLKVIFKPLSIFKIQGLSGELQLENHIPYILRVSMWRRAGVALEPVPFFMQTFQLPPLDRILDLARTRPDFPNMHVSQFLQRTDSLLIQPPCDSLTYEKKHIMENYKMIDQSSIYDSGRKSAHSLVQNQTATPQTQTVTQNHNIFINNALDDDYMKVGAWSSEEDALLKQLVMKHGRKWKPVSEGIPGRNVAQCKKRFQKFKENAARALSSISEPY